MAFADKNTGACKQGFVAIPQLRITISYDIPRDVQVKGQFALDSFPEEDHNPFSDHNDFVNVNSARHDAEDRHLHQQGPELPLTKLNPRTSIPTAPPTACFRSGGGWPGEVTAWR